MRASRILATKPDRALIALAQLCEEREEELVPAAPGNGNPYLTTAGRLHPLPPQVPYTVGSSQNPPPVPIQIVAPGSGPILSADSFVNNGTPASVEAKEAPRPLFQPLSTPSPSEGPAAGPSSTISPSVNPTADPLQQHMHGRKTSVDVVAEGGTPKLQHMAPTRSKWTSPPPPDAPLSAHDSYRNNLGLGLSLATSSTPAREIPAEKRSPSATSTASSASGYLRDGDEDGAEGSSQPGSPGASSAASADVGNTSFESAASTSTVVPGGESVGLRHPVPMRLQLGKQSVSDLGSSSPDHEHGRSPRMTPRASQNFAPQSSPGNGGGRGRASERSDAGPASASASASTPTNGKSATSFFPYTKPLITPSTPRRSSSGPPTLQSPPPTATATAFESDPASDTSGVAGPSSSTTRPYSTASSPSNSRNPPLTLDTAGYYNPPVSISPNTSPKKNSSPLAHSNSSHYPQSAHPGHLSHHPQSNSPLNAYHQPRSAWPEFPGGQYYVVGGVPSHLVSQAHSQPMSQSSSQTPSQNHSHTHSHSRAPSGSSSPYHHRHSASGSSSHHYPVTLYRTQAPQATTFPLYQQVQPSAPTTGEGQADSNPTSINVSGSPTYESVHFQGNGTPGARSPANSISGKEGRPSPPLPVSQSGLSSSGLPSFKFPASPKANAAPPANIEQTTANPSTTQKSQSSDGTPKQSETTNEAGSSREKKPSPPSSQNVSRNGSLARKKYDPSAAFRIPTTTKSSPGSPAAEVLPPSPPESVTGKSSSPAGSVSGGSPGVNGGPQQYRPYQPYHNHHYRRSSASSPGGSGPGSSPVPSPTSISPAMTGASPSPMGTSYVRGVPMMAGVTTTPNGMQVLVPLPMPIPIPMPHGMPMTPSSSSPRPMRGSPIPAAPHVSVPSSRGASPGPASMERERSSSYGGGNGNGVPTPSRRGTNASNSSSYSSSSLKGAHVVEFEASSNGGRSPTTVLANGSGNGSAESVYAGTWSGAR